MAANKRIVAALTQRLGEKEKENVELEERYSALLDACESLEKQLDTKYKLSKLSEYVANNENPIVITGVKIGNADFCVLSQGKVYSLFHGDFGTSRMLYFAPKAYYPAERLLECYFVIGTRGTDYDQLFIPEYVHGLQSYNRFEGLLPNWAQRRDYMLPLDFDNMQIVHFHRDNEINGIKTIAKQINPRFQWLTTIIPGMRDSYSLRLIIPDYKYLKENLS